MSFKKNPNIDHDFTSTWEKYTFNEIVIAELYLPTGKIVCGDPVSIEYWKPFKHKVEPGKYPVILSMYKIDGDCDRVAFARIRFSNHPAIRWTQAITENISDDEVASIEPGEFYGYPVDTGIACFTDAETNELFTNVKNDLNDDNGSYLLDIRDEFEVIPGGSPDGTWNNHHPLKDDARNVVVFSAGLGDGTYPVYWGYDKSGNVVELITDFGVAGYEDL